MSSISNINSANQLNAAALLLTNSLANTTTSSSFTIADIPFSQAAETLSNSYGVTPSNVYGTLNSATAPLPNNYANDKNLGSEILNGYAYSYQAPYKVINNWSDFESGYYQFFNNQVGSSYSIDKTALYNGFLQDFATTMGIQINSDGSVGGSWASLNTSSPTLFDENNPNNPMILAFNQFASTVQNSNFSSPTAYNSASNLMTSFQNFLVSNFTLIGPPYVDPTASNQNAFQNVASFETIYNTYNPGATATDFQNFMQSFYTNEVKIKGYFLPSTSTQDFANAVQNKDPTNVTYNELPNSSISETGSHALLVLNEILALLIKLIGTLQQTGVAQAQRLNYYTNFQNAYTAMQSQVPVFTQNQMLTRVNADGSVSSFASPIGIATGANSTEAGQVRNDLNSAFNGIISDNIRSLRDIQQNNAKQIQSNVNTTNDAVNQQTDMVSTFLQQLSTMLSSILR